MMDVGNGMQLQIEFVAMKDYPLLPKPSWIAGHAVFFAARYPKSSMPFLDADTVFSETPAGEERWAFRQFMWRQSDGWRLDVVEAPKCKGRPEVMPCEAPLNVPDAVAVVGPDTQGCRGDTLMTAEPALIIRPYMMRDPRSELYAVVEPVSDIHWIGKLNGSDTLFFATLISPRPVFPEERRTILEMFSKTCGEE